MLIMKLKFRIGQTLIYTIIFIFIFTFSISAQDQFFLDETEIRLPQTGLVSNSADVADIDGDGDLDIIGDAYPIFPPNNPYYLFINDGMGIFSQESFARLPDTTFLTIQVGFTDIENDGDYDAYIVSEHNQDLLLVNDGMGYFSDETTLRCPLVDCTNSYFYSGDISGDAYWDLITICVYETGLNHYLLNDGTGYFEDVTEFRMPIDTLFDGFIEGADIDNDLDLDLLIFWFENSAYRHLRGLENIDGHFYHIDESILPDCTAFYIETADIDNDGDSDIIASGVISRSILINYGGLFVNESELRLPEITPDPGGSTNFTIGDFDNDNDLDIYFGFATDALDHLFINDGDGYFTQADERLPDSTVASTRWPEAFDADHDGDLDLYLGCSGDGQQRILINYSTPDSFPPEVITYDLPEGLIDSSSEYWFAISTYDNISVEKGSLNADLIFNVDNNDYDTLSMIYCDGTIFKNKLINLSVGSSVQYYISIKDKMNNETRIPDSAPDSLFRFIITPVTSIDEMPELPKRPTITVYPNPFNSSCNITVSESGIDFVSIYDIKGRLVKTLEIIDNTASWNASDFPSGVYLFKPRNSTIKEVNKAILIR